MEIRYSTYLTTFLYFIEKRIILPMHQMKIDTSIKSCRMTWYVGRLNKVVACYFLTCEPKKWYFQGRHIGVLIRTPSCHVLCGLMTRLLVFCSIWLYEVLVSHTRCHSVPIWCPSNFPCLLHLGKGILRFPKSKKGTF